MPDIKSQKLYSEESFGSSFPELEEELIETWKRNRIFQRSVEERPIEEQFVMYDGPPFATGLPHYGHILPHVIKDVIPRYQTMKGRRVERRFGWDCHGLPVEYLIEKELGANGKKDIEERIGIDAFNEKCRESVLKYVEEWKKIEDRMGRWVDMENDYKTMDISFMESVWYAFKKLFEKGLIYEGKKVVAYSPRIATPLSNFEAGLNYQEVQSPAITLTFPLEEEPETSLLAWTTTPWTLPSNLALAVNPEIQYVKVKTADGVFILAGNSTENFFKGKTIEVEEVDISRYLGKRYQPMFDFLKDETTDSCYRIYAADFVKSDEGTGIVHIAPAFGEDDFVLGEQEGLPVLDPLDAEGKFTAEIPIVQGLWFKDADRELIKDMKSRDRIFKHETIQHNYPFCWRSDTPLMYRAISSWYVRVEKLREKLISNNEQVNWVPESIGKKRFHNWLANARDWAISRNRFWGAPIPIWKEEKSGELICVGSIAELEELTGNSVTDLHRHKIDHLVINKDGKTYRRVPEVLDCWFESGSMPYGQAHYPFENRDLFEKNFPADFIAEGLDQTRGWFYTLLVLSTALMGKPAYKNVVVNGIILGSDGKKMSKSLKNYPDPNEIFDNYGADAMRYYLLSSKATRAEEVRISEDDVKNVVKDVLLPLWNIFKFYVTYANIDRFEPDPDFSFDRVENELDAWLLYRTELFRADIERGLDNYDLPRVCAEIRTYIDDFSKWFLRCSRRRYWESGMEHDKVMAFEVLAYSLNITVRCIAPVLPFIADRIYHVLSRSQSGSVHLERWPQPLAVERFSSTFRKMDLVRKIVSLTHRTRTEQQIRTRQPLSRLILPSNLKEDIESFGNVICQEVNVKKVEFVEEIQGLIDLKVQLNAPVVGPRLGGKMREVMAKLNKGEYVMDGTTLTVADEKFPPSEYFIRVEKKGAFAGAKEYDLIVVLDTEITPELEQEGIIRDLVRQVQQLRKEADYQVEQYILLGISGEEMAPIVREFEDYVAKETLSSISYQPLQNPDIEKTIRVAGRDVTFTLAASA